jgi:hypothetical protein
MFRPKILYFKMHDLSHRMHTRIRPPSGNRLHRRTMNFSQGAFQVILQSTATGLRLPTAKVATIVFNAERNPDALWFRLPQCANFQLAWLGHLKIAT